MQLSHQPPFAAGDVVDARGNQWLVEETVAFADCTLLRLAALDPRGRRQGCKLLYPFDRPNRQDSPSRARAVTRRRWGHHLRAQLAECRTFGQLRAAHLAAIDIFPFQLEPALALVRGLASRVLLADEVGLGKTIQAGLMLAELQERGWCDRALILTPPGLRDQWAGELAQRFGIHAAVLDAASLRAMASTLPAGLNPWEVEPVAIASTDFIKQPEILQALRSLLWDIVIIDEAHQVATAPQRAATVNALAQRARHVALLTATPHGGEDAAYHALCSIGQLDPNDPICLFRRTRGEVGLGGARRTHLLAVRLSDDERDMHRLLAAYASRVWQIGSARNDPDLRLVAIVLSKRAFSSASSLAASLQRRIALLSGCAPPAVQPGLPFDVEEDAADLDPALGARAFDRTNDEQAALEAILAAAERARRDERKVDVLRRLLRRIREPAIVFTEYRDTLKMLEASLGFRRLVVLHGGLTRLQRQAAVEAFTGGHRDVLLATDAGSEGLNLQSACRLVINLELPWNPMRLEQRIGRVDRLGQARTVHAINLLARETAESRVLARLIQKVERIRQALDIAAEVIHDAHAGAAT